MLLFNELYRLNNTTENTFASTSTEYSFLKCHCIVLLYFTHTHKLTMITFLSLPTCKKLAVLPLLNVKSLVYLNKSCTNTFCRRGYGLRENDSSIYFSRITIPAFHAGDLKEGKNVQIYHSHIPININDMFQKQNIWYLPWIKSQTFRLHASVETAIEYDYRNEWPIVVTCYSR